MARRPVTLVLGGTGVKGIASIGVLQALAERELPLRQIYATGASGLVAVYYALSGDMQTLVNRLSRFFIQNHRSLWGMEWTTGLFQKKRHLLTESLAYFLQERLYCLANVKRVSVLEWDLWEPELEELLGDKTLSDLILPVSISAMDLRTQETVALKEGKLLDCVKAGLAFPGLFPPVNLNGRLLVSGAATCELPLDVISAADAPTLAVDFPTHFHHQHPSSLVEVMAQCAEIRADAIKQRLLEPVDQVFRLEGMANFQWGSYRRIPQMIQQAKQETERLLDATPAFRKGRRFLFWGDGKR